MKLLDNDSLFGRFFGTIGDIIALNLLFLLCSLPIVTFGASFTSLHFALLRRRQHSDSSAVRDFFQSFRQNFRQSTLAWLTMIVLIIVISADFGTFGPDGVMPFLPFYYLILLLSIILFFTSLYIFPVIAAFENSLKQLWIQSFFLAARNLPRTILIAILTVVPLAVTLLNATLMLHLLILWLMAGFSLIAWCTSYLYYSAFRPYLPLEELPSEYN
jgi:uncharacterized membrane protein YesL